MKIALSLTSIIDGVYALAALHAVTCSHVGSGSPAGAMPHPAILGRSHETSLRRVARDVFGCVLLDLIPIVSGSNISNADSEILELETAPEYEPADGSLFRQAVETAVTAGIFRVAWLAAGETGLARHYDLDFSRAIGAAKDSVRGVAKPFRRNASYFG